MAVKKTYKVLSDLLVFNSMEPTIEVNPEDGYNGAHRYRARQCVGFDSESQSPAYIYKVDTIQFVQKNEDGTVIPGWQSEQLALILLDRVKKLDEKFPCEANQRQIKALEEYLAACAERVTERINRGVMGELKK